MGGTSVEAPPPAGSNSYPERVSERLNMACRPSNCTPPDPERIRSDLMLLLREFSTELDAACRTSDVHGAGEADEAAGDKQPTALYTEAEWLSHLELKFLLRAHRMELLRAISRYIGGGGGSSEGSNATQIFVAKEASAVVEELLQKTEAYAERRLKATDPNLHPMVLRLASRYKLSTGESDLFQLLFMRGASKAAAVRAILGVRQEDKELAMELCGMSLLEVEDFLDDKRTHMTEGIIIGQDDYDGKTIRMTNEAVSVLLLRPLKTEQRLKFSKTELLNVMEASKAEGHIEGVPMETEEGGPDASFDDKIKDTSSEQSLMTVLDVSKGMPGQKRKFQVVHDDGLEDVAAQVAELDDLVKEAILPQRKRAAAFVGEVGHSEPDVSSGLEPGINGGVSVPSVPQEDEAKRGELTSYKSSLEYLDDAFQVLALMLRIAKARHKEDMKEAFNDDRPWYDVYRTTKVSSIRELRAKLRFVQNRLQERMKLTEDAYKENSTQFPRLEALARRLGLDEFEKGVVVMLTGVAISPVVKSIFEADNGDGTYRHSSEAIQVKDILTVYFDSFKQQVLARTYFYKSSKLVSRGLIKLRPTPYARGGRGDLMDQQVELDRRMLDWIVGLDTEMNELVEGSHLYTPKIAMEQVVLPAEQKEMLLKTVENFAKFRLYRKRAGLEDIMSYGAGLVILLCGASGTGKTMTVNAVAHHLGKRVLMVDFHSLHSASSGSSRDDHSADLRGLFRDADMNDAIIFFDECEAIFAQRERGGDRMLNSLLTEMERHEGIIMLATNRPLDLDEAMHRRITCVSEFHPPDHTQRRAIWKLASERLPVEENIDWERISLRYELTGGYIKNALVSALLIAISRDSVNPSISEDDIVSGCRLQMRGSLQMKTFTHRVVPKTGMDELILSSQMREKMDAIVTFEKARAVLLGQWGFQQERLGTACFFWGPHGAGKTAAAEVQPILASTAIGFELGRPLKVINCAQLISRESSTKTGSNISTAFKDARLMDAVLVLEDFQIFRSDEESGGGGVGSVSPWSHVAIGLLLHELGRFPGICILIANNIQGSVVHRLDPELTRRLKFLVEFRMPDATIRSRMWQKLIPAKCPVAPSIKFETLGRLFDFTSGTISSAIVRAAAKASLRKGDACVLTYKDLVEAGEAEKAHLRDEESELFPFPGCWPKFSRPAVQAFSRVFLPFTTLHLVY
ncbi:hypothetical protein R1sor_010700 [Riccia sorocarpa]|uniref:AAA+ ATPase domain-containing protein n=1 Tax=Riccia sorocarpa TaxID=122646 RepID=A0ABD3I0N3_9MARC